MNGKRYTVIILKQKRKMEWQNLHWYMNSRFPNECSLCWQRAEEDEERAGWLGCTKLRKPWPDSHRNHSLFTWTTILVVAARRTKICIRYAECHAKSCQAQISFSAVIWSAMIWCYKCKATNIPHLLCSLIFERDIIVYVLHLQSIHILWVMRYAKCSMDSSTIFYSWNL